MQARAPDLDGGESTVLFVDLVRFTALMEIHGDEAGADAADALVAVVSGHLGTSVRLVKTLGDGVLVTTLDPVLALRTAAGVVEELHDLANGTDVRVGVHHGPVVERGGDIFGSTVNLAARAASFAAPGRIVATRPVAEAVAFVDLAAIPLGEQEVRGFVDPIELFEIDPCEHDALWVTDPVCGMRLTASAVLARRVGVGGGISFCSLRCAEIYDGHPDRFG